MLLIPSDEAEVGLKLNRFIVRISTSLNPRERKPLEIDFKMKNGDQRKEERERKEREREKESERERASSKEGFIGG